MFCVLCQNCFWECSSSIRLFLCSTGYGKHIFFFRFLYGASASYLDDVTRTVFFLEYLVFAPILSVFSSLCRHITYIREKYLFWNICGKTQSFKMHIFENICRHTFSKTQNIFFLLMWNLPTPIPPRLWQPPQPYDPYGDVLPKPIG